MNALLILDKPQGLSSHAAVHRVRKITGEPKVGHAGTLDPMATGVLVILLGGAARLSEYIVDHDKRYRATVRLGAETDTYDATGTVVATQGVQRSPDEIITTLLGFVGKQDQIPPAHSAIQVQGKRAYRMARQGVPLELQPRAVEFYSIENVKIEGDLVTFDVHCSKGTYIRSLAHDLGARLNTGGHLAALARTASGSFTIEQALSLDQVAANVADKTLELYLVPMDMAVPRFDAVHLDVDRARAVRNGQFIACPHNLTTPLVRAYDERNEFFAILEQNTKNQLKPVKVLK